MTVDSNSSQVGAACVTSEKSALKCSSMKSGVFPFALCSHEWGVEGVFPTFNPNCGSVHKLPPMNNCCHSLRIKAACHDC